MVYIRNFARRLGNQLFQLAPAISLSKDNDSKVYFPPWPYASSFKGDFSTPKDKPTPHKMIKEGTFHYRPIPYSPNVILNGYFQSEKYFKNNEKTIREMFAPTDENIKALNDKYEEFLSNPIVSIHVRRGDYLKWPSHHPVITSDYIKESVNKFPKHKFLVFSDDKPWCRNNLKDDIFHIVEGQNDRQDFILMSMCNHNIISNSTYSWWAAWLNSNSNKKVIAPKRWFGPSYRNYNTKDLYPDGWEAI